MNATEGRIIKTTTLKELDNLTDEIARYDCQPKTLRLLKDSLYLQRAKLIMEMERDAQADKLAPKKASKAKPRVTAPSATVKPPVASEGKAPPTTARTRTRAVAPVAV